MSWRAAAAAVVTVALLGLAAPHPAAAASVTAAGCAHVTVPLGQGLADMTMRIKRRGALTCTLALRLTRTYFKRRLKPGACDGLGMYCWMMVTRRWLCGIYSAGASERGGGADAFCADQRNRRRAFNLFEVLPPGRKEYPSFLSADRTAWCGIGNDGAFCLSTDQPDGNGTAQSAGNLTHDGEVTICQVSEASFQSHCVQNWDPRVPVLKVGQSVENAGLLCVSAADGITCTATTGPRAGAGFRVGAGTAAELGATQ